MMKNQKVKIPVFLLLLVSSTLFVTPQAHAFGFGAKNGNIFTDLVHTIAQKFGLDENQVQSTVNEYHKQKMQSKIQTMQDREKLRLDKLVKDGKITSAQESAIIAKLQDIKNKYNPTMMQNLTPQERRTQMQTMQNDLKTWAQSQGIDMQYVLPFGGMGMMRGMHKGWSKNGITPTPTP